MPIQGSVVILTLVPEPESSHVGAGRREELFTLPCGTSACN